MNKLFKNVIVFMGTIFAIFMGLFGLAGVYTSIIGTKDSEGTVLYSLTFGIICLAIAATTLFLTAKLHYHK